ncbi:MAG: CBS domain-containing protein [Planctomycetota bacterium]|jgi:acetoin utilization protein AcuB
MYVRDWMTRSPVTIQEDSTFTEAWALMREKRLRHLPVMRGEDVVGIVSDRDIRDAAPSSVQSSGTDTARIAATKIKEICSGTVFTTNPDTELERAAVKLYVHRIGALPVTEGGRLVGIISETDVFRAMVRILGFQQDGERAVLPLGGDRPTLAQQLEGLEELGQVVTHVVTYDAGDGTLHAVVRTKPAEG